MSNENIYIPTDSEMRATFKNEATRDFFVKYGNDHTAGHGFFPYMVRYELMDGWHILAFTITVLAIVYGFIDSEPWANLFFLPYTAYWIGSFVNWRKKKKGDNPNRYMEDIRGKKSLAWFVKDCHDALSPLPDAAHFFLKWSRKDLFKHPKRPSTDDPKFWGWLNRNW